jgi:SAM-dependent methyltransferase
MELKNSYAINHSRANEKSLYLNQRLFNTYNRISEKTLNKKLDGVNVDLGSGDCGFSKYCESVGVKSCPYDYPAFDIEKDKLPHESKSIDFVTMNAVIEHIKNIDNIMSEIYKVLKIGGLLFVRTPNWKMDWKNFYNDPTHVAPYTPQRLKNLFELFKFETIFLEPGLIEKSWFWWKLPGKIKWRISAWMKGGTKSIICVGRKIS